MKQIANAKSAVVSLSPYPAFNKAISAFRFFAERAATRPQHREQALRGAYFAAALACLALDAASERLVFEEKSVRHKLLYAGVTYGDVGDGRVKSSINTVLDVIANGVKNGKVIARQTGDAIDEMFAGLRAEIIAEFFAKDENSQMLFPVARELEGKAHARSRSELTTLSLEAKSVLGVFSDFVGSKRTALFSADFASAAAAAESMPSASSEPEVTGTGVGGRDDTFPGDRPPKLL